MGGGHGRVTGWIATGHWKYTRGGVLPPFFVRVRNEKDLSDQFGVSKEPG